MPAAGIRSSTTAAARTAWSASTSAVRGLRSRQGRSHPGRGPGQLQKRLPRLQPRLPANAIIFPQHKSAAIAGADGEVGSLKIDLSQLFGGASAVDQAVAERDAELIKDGRDAVGATVGLPKRQAGLQDRPKDALDDLMDGLEQLEF